MYNTALAVFFLAYIIFEVPANVRPIIHLFTLPELIQLTIIADNVRSPSIFPRGYRYFSTCHFSLKRFDPQFWLPSLTLCWGIVTTFQGLIVNQAGLFGIRFREYIPPFLLCHFNAEIMWNLVLGFAEAGLFPGTIYVFSVYYRRHERSWRVAIFFGGAALAGAFGGRILLT